MLRMLTRVLFGFVLACLTAGLAIVLFVMTPVDLANSPGDALTARATDVLVWSLLTATHAAIFAFAFTLIAAGLGEWLRIRSALYYTFAGLGIALLGFYAQLSSEASGAPTILNGYALAAFATAGALGGLVYWFVAGRRAGGRGSRLDVGGDRVGSAEAPTVRPRLIVEDQTVEIATAPKRSLSQRLNETEAEDVTIVTRPTRPSGASNGGAAAKSDPAKA